MSVTNATAISGIDIVTYVVQDADRAKAFYRDVLGLTISTDYGPPGAEFELGDGTTFGIWKMDDGSFQPSAGVMFGVPDIKAAVETFGARGVAFENGGAIEENPTCLMAFAKDSEGNSFILHQRK